DPQKCLRCSNCATHCVLEQSAVKCVHAYAICGYCQLCTGYFEPEPNDLNTGAENCLCPTAAIKRTYVDDPYYEYTIDENLCIGGARCGGACTLLANASLFLQSRQDCCETCKGCPIAKPCRGDPSRRGPAAHPYLLKPMILGDPCRCVICVSRFAPP